MGVLWIFLEALGGLGKGDPLSPFLFDVVLEALSCMLDVAIAAGQFSSFSVGSTPSTSMMVSRLLFVNDTIINDADPNQLVTLRGILNRFEDVSGFRINLGK